MIENPPGRTSLDARLGTHGSFLAEALTELGRKPALAPLTTRDPGDPTIALVDAAAAILDVLTFYRERITNEGYLATATERRSVAGQPATLREHHLEIEPYVIHYLTVQLEAAGRGLTLSLESTTKDDDADRELLDGLLATLELDG